MLSKAKQGVSKLHRKLKAACRTTIPSSSPGESAVGHWAPGRTIEPPKLCGMEADTAVRVAKVGKLIGWITSFVPGLGNVGKAIRAAASAGQRYGEQEIELAAVSKSTFEILVNLNRFLSVLQIVCGEMSDDELQNLGVSAAAERIQSLSEEFTEAMVEKYGDGDKSVKATMTAMFFALADADAAIGSGGEGEEEEEEEEEESVVPEIDLKFLDVVKDKCQRCMAEITFCVSASQAVLQQKQAKVMSQEMMGVMQKLDQVVGLQQKLQTHGSVGYAVEAVRLQLVQQHKQDTGQILDRLKQGFSQVLVGQEQLSGRLASVKRELQAAQAMQRERDNRLKAELQNIPAQLEHAIAAALQKQQPALAGQQAPAAVSGAATAHQLGHSSERGQELIERLRKLRITKQSSRDPGVKKSKEKLGSGGQAGSVVKGTLINQRMEETPVAIKTYTVQEGKELEAERGLVEAYLMRAATSVSEGRRHVVHCFGVVHKPRQTFPNPIDDEEPEVIVSPEYWLVLELTLDGSLHDALHGPAADAGWVQQREEGWLTGLAAALAFVHSVLHVTHCDVKPSNCLLFNDARHLKLADFGSAYQASNTAVTFRAATTRGVGYTELYASPEQLMRRPLSPKADVWCFGMVVYEVLVGEVAGKRQDEQAEKKEADMQKAKEKDQQEKKGQQVNEEKWYPALRKPSRWSGKQVADALAELLKRCWQQSPEARPDMKAVLQALSNHYTPPLPKPKMEEERRRRQEDEERRKAEEARKEEDRKRREEARAQQEREEKELAEKKRLKAEAVSPAEAARKGKLLLQALSIDNVVVKGKEKAEEEAVQLIRGGADVHVKGENGRTPLHLASRNGHEGLARVLLEHNADVHAKNDDECTPLHFASDNGDEGLARVLLEHNADVHAKDIQGSTPLHYASAYGDEGLARVLLEHNADVHAKSNWPVGRTPMSYASGMRNTEVVALLKAWGAKE